MGPLCFNHMCVVTDIVTQWCQSMYVICPVIWWLFDRILGGASRASGGGEHHLKV